ncbi:esterase family protein [Luteolibacter sp. AS25]|uniref:esterase family protein n=1 Tax=Luteolibacter sp. AS25 TaxID=3135776 RepID=UPI00398B3044
MKREYHKWWSENLNRDMEMLVFGHAGAKVLVFPTRDGRFFEYEDLRLTEVLRHKIEAGQLQLYCLDGISNESFYCFWAHPSGRIQRYLEYEAYVLEEVIPFADELNDHPCIISHGCSLGGYFAANIVFRHPKPFSKLVAFSGRYDLTLKVESFDSLLGAHYDDEVYFNTPTHFLPGLKSKAILKELRRIDMIFVIGRQDPFVKNNEHLSRILTQKKISHRLHYWPGRAHRGRFWREMAPHFV